MANVQFSLPLCNSCNLVWCKSGELKSQASLWNRENRRDEFPGWKRHTSALCSLGSGKLILLFFRFNITITKLLRSLKSWLLPNSKSRHVTNQEAGKFPVIFISWAQYETGSDRISYILTPPIPTACLSEVSMMPSHPSLIGLWTAMSQSWSVHPVFHSFPVLVACVLQCFLPPVGSFAIVNQGLDIAHKMEIIQNTLAAHTASLPSVYTVPGLCPFGICRGIA